MAGLVLNIAGSSRSRWPIFAALMIVMPVKGQLLQSGRSEFGAWAGYSFTDPTMIGTTTNRRFINAGFRYGFVFGTKRDVAFEYTLDFVPAAILIQPPGAQMALETGDNRFAGRGRSAVYGGGISPIGFKFNLARQRKVQPFFSATAGFVYSLDTIPVPVPEATRFNFTFDFGGGVQLFRSGGKALMLGYKLNHISNAGRPRVNPGVDMSVFYAGFSLFR